MKVEVIKKVAGFTVDKVYKVEKKTKGAYLLENDRGYKQLVKRESCEKVGIFKGLFK